MNTSEIDRPHRRMPSAAVLIGGAVLLASLGAAAGWIMRAAAPVPTQVAGLSASEELVDRNTERRTERDIERSTPAPRSLPAPVKSAPRVADNDRYRDDDNRSVRPVAQCRNCGTVESVNAIKRKAAEGTGVGAVAGGVLGGVLGNQVGDGTGRSAATVIGVIGGGLAGNEVEKRVRGETVYEVRVRLDDGSVRTLTQRTAPALGSRVVVDGGTLRSASQSREPALMRTADNGGA